MHPLLIAALGYGALKIFSKPKKLPEPVVRVSPMEVKDPVTAGPNAVTSFTSLGKSFQPSIGGLPVGFPGLLYEDEMVFEEMQAGNSELT